MDRVRVYLQLEPVRPERLAAQLGGKDSLLGRADTARVGEQLNVRPLDVSQHVVVLVLHVDALHRDGHHLGAARRYGTAHRVVAAELASPEEQARTELTARYNQFAHVCCPFLLFCLLCALRDCRGQSRHSFPAPGH